MSNLSGGEVHLIMMGGTIDSAYIGRLDTVEPLQESIMPRFMSWTGVDRPLQFTEVCLKDSRMITDEDRSVMTETIRQSTAIRFLITHGTYTMRQSAQLLAREFDGTDTVVAMTGSLSPIEGFSMTDGGFNIGFAFAQLDCRPPGIYVCINGRAVRVPPNS